MPKLQANQCGAADAVMLDADGFVSETNATNLFLVKHGHLLTPHADACVPGTGPYCMCRDNAVRIVIIMIAAGQCACRHHEIGGDTAGPRIRDTLHGKAIVLD